MESEPDKMKYKYSDEIIVYIHLTVAILSTSGAFLMSVMCYRTLQRRQFVLCTILFFLASSDFIFSLTSLIARLMTIAEVENFEEILLCVFFVQTLHWAFEVASFLWTGTLALYVLKKRGNNFDLSYAHNRIWFVCSAFWILEIICVRTNNQDAITFARLCWDVFAIGTLALVVLAIIIHARRSSTDKFSNSIVISRLVLYMVAYIIFVLPNVYSDILFFLGSPHNTNDFECITSIIFSCLPFVNSLIFMVNCKCLQGPRRSSLTDSGRLIDLPELKGLELGDRIGQGIAVVYKGKWRGAEVAVKMQAFSSEQAEFLQSSCNEEIQQEANLMRSLTHPNIVLFMEAGFYRGSICIVSEYCSNGSLRDILECTSTDKLVWPMKLRLAIGIAHGLQYLHHSSVRMIHRDLKSPNIVVDETWHAKIADFGTLRFSEIVTARDTTFTMEDRNSEMTGLVGTTRWMAPEVITSGTASYDEKIDIYSFGMILWELIEHRLPFDHLRWNTEIENEIVKENRPEFTSLSVYPQRLQPLIQSCWDQNPMNRPSIESVLQDLQQIANEDIWISNALETPGISSSTIGRSASTNDLVLQNIHYTHVLNHMACDADFYIRESSDVNGVESQSGVIFF